MILKLKKRQIFAISIFLSLIPFQFLLSQSNIPKRNFWITNKGVSAIQADSNYIYIGGKFSYVGPNTGSIALVTTENSNPNLDFPLVTGATYSILPDDNGGFYVCGAISKIGSEDVYSLARIKPDFSVDLNFKPKIRYFNPIYASESNGSVYSIAKKDGMIYLGGSFNKINDKPIVNIARINQTNGELDTTFSFNSNFYITFIAIDNEYLYVAGLFTQINGKEISRLAKININTKTLEESWNPNPNGNINYMKIEGDYLYVGGQFTSIGGKNIKYLAKINKNNGQVDESWNPNPSDYVHTFEILNGYVYVGGAFYSIGGGSQRYLAKLNLSDGSLASNWKPNIPWVVYSIGIKDNYLYAGGYSYTTSVWEITGGITKVNLETGAKVDDWEKLALSYVRAFAFQGNNIFIGGEFASLGGVLLKYLAKIDIKTGLPVASWNPEPNDEVTSLLLKDGFLFVGGKFTYIKTDIYNQISYLAKVNTQTGKAIGTWKPSPNNMVTKILSSANDEYLYISGGFTKVGNFDRIQIAKIHSGTGDVDQNWVIVTNSQAPGFRYLVDDNYIYLTGSYTKINNIDVTYYTFTRVNKTNAEVDTNFIIKTNATEPLQLLLIDGNYLYLTGMHVSYFIGNKFIIPRPVKYNISKKAVDSTWSIMISGSYSKITKHGDDIFMSINNNPKIDYGILARVNNPSQTYFENWKPIFTGVQSSLTDVFVSQNTIFAAGSFSRVNDCSQIGLAAFDLMTSSSETTILNIHIVGNKVILNWKNNNNYSFFDIYRSDIYEGKMSHWKKIARINDSNAKSLSYEETLLKGSYQYFLKMYKADGSYDVSNTCEIIVGDIYTYELYQNYPNPFNPTTTISYYLPEETQVKLRIYDAMGRLVKELVNEKQTAGSKSVTFDASLLSSGVYFYELQAGSYMAAKKMILMK